MTKFTMRDLPCPTCCQYGVWHVDPSCYSGDPEQFICTSCNQIIAVGIKIPDKVEAELREFLAARS